MILITVSCNSRCKAITDTGHLCCSYFRGKGKLYSPASEWHEAVRLDSQNLQAVVVADSYPVWLSRCPLYIVDFSLCCISQDRVLNGTGHLLDIPDESLMVISCKGKRNSEVESECTKISTHSYQQAYGARSYVRIRLLEPQ